MLYWYLLTAGSCLGIGYLIGARRKASELEQMREEVRKDVREEERRRTLRIDRFHAERLMREADEEFETRHGE